MALLPDVTDATFERDLHRRLLERDHVAPEVLAETYLGPVVLRLRATAPGTIDSTMLQDAAADAILNYAERPTQYDPTKSRLFTYLVMAARGDLRNALTKQRRRERREILSDRVEDLRVEDPSMVRNLIEEEPEPAPVTGEAVGVEEVKRAVETTITDPTDRRFVELMLSGERRTKAFAAVLDIAHLATEQQRRIVKRHKDRLKKRIERLGVKLRGPS